MENQSDEESLKSNPFYSEDNKFKQEISEDMSKSQLSQVNPELKISSKKKSMSLSKIHNRIQPNGIIDGRKLNRLVNQRLTLSGFKQFSSIKLADPAEN